MTCKIAIEHEPKAPAQPGAEKDVAMETVACPVCAAEQDTFCLHAQELRYGMGGQFTIVRCDACGLKYTNPRPTAQSIGHYYPDHYYTGRERDEQGGKRRSGRHQGIREKLTRSTLVHHLGYPGGQRRWLSKLLIWPIALHLRYGRRGLDAIRWCGDGRLLDFGCGGCKFLRLQRDRGWQTAGIDFSDSVVRWARQEDGLDVVQGTWPGAAMADRTFDVITAWHVLEHVPDPVGWMRHAVQRLAPGGYLLVCCPDSDSWACRRFGPYWTGLDVPRHFSHFTRHDLAKLMRDAGLTVQRTRGQVRPTTLKLSARLHAQGTGSRWWRLLGRSSLPWRVVAALTGWAGAADGVVVIGCKRGEGAGVWGLGSGAEKF